MATPLPSLSVTGWIYDTRKILDMAMAHAFVSDASHSSTCPDSITSFQALVQKFENNPDALATNVESKFQKYLERYIPTIRVQVSWTPNDPKDPDNGVYILTIKLSAVMNGEAIDMAEALTISGSLFSRIKKLNNEGI